MTRRAPWHSERLGDLVYHDNERCAEGKGVPALYRGEGTGGRPLCKTCARLDAEQGEALRFERDGW
jgi:hypothetical protein